MFNRLEKIFQKAEKEVRVTCILLIAGVVLLVVAFLLLLYFYIKHREVAHVTPTEKYPLLSKRVFIQDSNDLIVNFLPLRKAVKEYVSKQNGTVGVYFEYLPSGTSIGANDTEEIKLASLSKVPLAMSILKKIEKGEITFETKVQIKREHLNSTFGDLWKNGAGAEFTVRDLLEYSLKYSDNTAYEALFSILTDEEIIEVYDNLEIEVSSKESDPHVSPKSYSSIFRSLYLATYNSKKDSNYLLDLLTKTAFHDKLPAGVPSNIPVSHKIGVFSIANKPDRVYSDCGIVYYPLRPYILCVFVEDEESKAVEHISYISKMVYGFVDLVEPPDNN